MDCPACGGPMWFNAPETKKNPKGPDYKCKDKDCGKAVWLKSGGFKGGAKPAPVERGPKWTWGALSALYANCVKLAVKHSALIKGATSTDVTSMAATLFIAASRDGVKSEEAAKAKAADPDDDFGDEDAPY